MGSDKTNIFLVAIVGIVAVAGLVFLFSGRGSTATEDSISGDAFWSNSESIWINQKDYFALTDGEGKLHLYQYKGGDSPSDESPQIGLKDVETGETILLDYIWQKYEGGVKTTLVVGNPGEPCSAEDNSGCTGKTKYYQIDFRSNADKQNLPLRIYPVLDTGQGAKLSFKSGTLKLPSSLEIFQ